METIGFLTLYYRQSGELLNAVFEPNTFSISGEVLDRMNFTDGSIGQDKIKDTAERVLSAWFQRQNKIELADRGNNDIETKVLLCEKWPNDSIKKVSIQFTFNEKTATMAGGSVPAP